ncbi:adenylate/guanylate cyclase domain-containing protein [Roseicella frigidaeris]|nr:adenylate/guanylate cyclase domain-containing protein [Roseicella frigidaeris]
MRCGACGAANPEARHHCSRCGARLGPVCPACAHANPPDSLFCSQCGLALSAGLPAPPPGPPRGSGELKQATVLFVDIPSSAELVAALAAEQAMERLEQIIAVLCRTVERHGGTVATTLEDGLMALFGAPRAQEGHAVLACQAALALQAAFPPAPGAPTLRIGLHVGEIVADAPDADPGRARQAHGLTIHVANRIMALAPAGTVLISDAVERLVRGPCRTQPFGRHALRGVPAPMGLHSLLGLAATLPGRDFHAPGRTSFRGRAAEMRLLREALAAAGTGAAQLVAIAGAPGVGKSRLCFEFAAWCRAQGVTVHDARALSYGRETPLSPVIGILRQLLFDQTRAEEDATPEGVAARLARLEAGFAADAALVCGFLGIPCPEASPRQIEPALRLQRLREILAALLRQRGDQVSLILIEDLHWLDVASEGVVAALAEAAAGSRTMLLLNYRPEFRAAWLREAQPQAITLQEMGQEEIGALVGELLGRRRELARLRDELVERSGGNPFFAEELVRSLVEAGTLTGPPGALALAPGTRVEQLAPTLPATLQAVIGARIDRLAAPERWLLQLCAVIGKDVAFDVLERVSRLPVPQIDAGLTQLCEAGLLTTQPGPEGVTYAFRHPMIQEVAYATQLRARRAPLHAAVAAFLEAQGAEQGTGRLEQSAGLLAYHHEAAGHAREAAIYGARAAHFAGRSSHAQAVRHWHRVRELLRAQPRTPATDPLRIMASAQVAYRGWMDGMTAEAAQPYIQEALAWAREIDDRMVPLLHFVDGRIAGASGGPADAYVARVRQAMALLQPGRDAGRAATLNASLCQAYGWAGLLREALAASDAALAGLAHLEPEDEQFLGFNIGHWVTSLRGRVLLRLGRLAEARACLAGMLALDEALVAPTVRYIGHFGLSEIAILEGDLAEAGRHALLLSGMAARHRMPYLQAWAFDCEASYRARIGEAAEAARLYTEGLDLVRRAHVAMEIEADMLAGLAECRRGMGAASQALSTALAAEQLARRRNARLAEGRACITQAAAWLDQQGAEGAPRATTLLDRAEALIAQTGAISLRRRLDPVAERLARIAEGRDGPDA